ncbi:hypothetical protein [Cupriavidus campinensis]|uniref:hypothetical protein n=1 Tax=Cupriavidus campinensis TaxID=151783 RepID=UPI00165688BC|nr:hypothetical protein [Cupriavidus campinensis]
MQAYSAPDERLYSAAQTLYFTQGTQVHVETVSPGTTTPLALPAGTYTVTASPLSNYAGTVVSTAHVQPSTVTVTPGTTSVIMVLYDPGTYTAALDISIGDIPVLADELLDVTVVPRSAVDPIAAFSTPPGHLTQLRGLPLLGVADINVATIAVNNVRHSFPSQHRTLETTLQFVSFTAADMRSTPVNTSTFVTLPVVITSDVTVTAPLDVRLVAPNMSYHQTFHLAAGTHSYNLAVPVEPQTYAVEVSDFIFDGVVYNTQAADHLVVLSTGKTQLHIDVSQGASLKVRGFPDFLSFGGCADLTPGNAVDFVAARASSVFKYAGFDGAGDPGQYLSDDAQTTRTILLARDVEKQIGGGHKVLPVMVSYTCNLSLGDTPTQLANTQGLAHSFGNLILSLNLAKAHTDVDHPVPCGFVVNPDFLGACQQGGFAPDYAMPVREPLRQALAHWKVVATIPQNIEENIRGYVAAVNWLIRTVAPAVTFGWQVNLWGWGPPSGSTRPMTHRSATRASPPPMCGR